MVRKTLKIATILFVMSGVLVIATVRVIDRTPYSERRFYAEMNQRLDSLSQSLLTLSSDGEFRMGWSQINSTPLATAPLAGYGARNPKEMEGVQDSSYVRTIVFSLGEQKTALITADLLIVHPALSNYVWGHLPEGWKRSEVFFTASHTHSGQGGWAPGWVGEAIAGSYDATQVQRIGDAMIQSITQAENQLAAGSIGYASSEVPDLVRNRLVGEQGATDPFLKVLRLQKDTLSGLLAVYSAHATCFGPANRQLSGDYPAALIRKTLADSLFAFAAFAAGAVGSMGPAQAHQSAEQNAAYLGTELATQAKLLQLIGGAYEPPAVLRAFHLRLPLPDPSFKISKNLALRPYLFRALAGEAKHHLSVLQLGRTVMIGLPCDFSGELAVPLYEKAEQLGLQLILTSFNGDYIGYVIRDEWYDLPKYEARTMSWYGHDAGSYFSEIISRLLDILHENHHADPSD